MSERKFLNCIITEGVLLFLLGLFMLILPKVTPLSFGFIVSFSFISYGLYKAFNAFIMRNMSLHYIIEVLSGIMLASAGILLLFLPYVNLMLVIALTGCYFFLASLSSSSRTEQVKGILKLRGYGYFVSFIQFLFGLITVFILPSGAVWITGILISLDFLLSGTLLINMFFATKYSD